MSTILIIDKNPNEIISELSGFKGVAYFSATDIIKASQLLLEQQFDYVLCDHQIANEYFLKENHIFRESCLKTQPICEFYYIVNSDAAPQTKQVKNEMYNAHGIIRRPMGYNIMQIIVGTDLVDQVAIDELFKQYKKKT